MTDIGCRRENMLHDGKDDSGDGGERNNPFFNTLRIRSGTEIEPSNWMDSIELSRKDWVIML